MPLDVVITQTPKPVGAIPAAPEGVVIPTPEEIAGRARETFSAMGWDLPDKLKPKPEEAPVTAPPVVPAPAPAAQPLNTDDLVAKTATAVASEVARVLKPAPAAPSAAPSVSTEDMVDDDRQDYEAVQFIEQSNRRYAGLADRFMAWLKAIYDYEEAWSAKNPDKQFNPSDEEHDTWYDQNPSPVDRKTIDQAKIDKAVEAQYQQRVAPEMKQMKAERSWTHGQADIFLTANRKVLEVVRAICPELAVVFTDASGGPAFSDENAAKAELVNPIANDIVNRFSAQVWPMIVELEKTVLPDLEIRLTASNEVHASIMRLQDEEERRILADPAERTKDGKRFVGVRDWNRMSESERENCRTLTVDDMEAVIVRVMSERGKKAFEYQESLAAKRYGKTPEPALRPGETRREAPPKPVPGPIPSGMRQPLQPAPSISSASDVVSTPGTAPAKPKSYGETATSIHFA